MMTTMRRQSIAQAKAHFSELVDLAAREGVPLCTLDREMFVRGTACVVIPP
jgi:hypothetical protein